MPSEPSGTLGAESVNRRSSLVGKRFCRSLRSVEMI